MPPNTKKHNTKGKDNVSEVSTMFIVHFYEVLITSYYCNTIDEAQHTSILLKMQS
jgi:hypothetical protein